MSVDEDIAQDSEPMRSNPVMALVMRAGTGDERAWDALVERYAPLIWSLCRRYRLDAADADDVGQHVWLLLVDHLGTVRDPAALPGWLATTTRRDANASLTQRRNGPPRGTSWTQRTSQTARPKRSSKGCWWPSDTWRYARHSRTCHPTIRN